MSSSTAPPAAPAPVAHPPAPVAPSLAPALQSTSTQTLPSRNPVLLNLPEVRLQFGRLNATRRRITINVDPNLLSRVWIKEYQVIIHSLGGVIAPPITQANYIRMSRTILLKRLHDIHEIQTSIRPNPGLPIARQFQVPQPSAELLYALGPYFSEQSGRQYYLTFPPAPPQDPPAWYAIDGAIFAQYKQLLDYCEGRFQTAEFPKLSDSIGQPLMFVVGTEDGNGIKTTRASCSLPTPADGFLRFMHEEFFTNNIPDFNECDLVMTEPLLIEDIVDRYVRSYVINTHA